MLTQNQGLLQGSIFYQNFSSGTEGVPTRLPPSQKTFDGRIVHLPFGKTDFSEEDLMINVLAAAKSVEANKTSGARGVYWKRSNDSDSVP
ncbi:hypothetical protein OROGR_030288 [Orobanche gracilis]